MRARAFWLLLLGLAAIATAARLALAVDVAGEIDSLRFVRGVVDFDVAAYRPHFPGYPVFILLGKALHALCGDPLRALALLCALAGGLLCIPVALGVRALADDERAALGAALLVAVNPLLWLHSEKLLSDMPGLLFLASALALAAPPLARAGAAPPPCGCRDQTAAAGDARRLLAGGLLLGLTLGVRLSYFPFVLSALALALRRRRAAADLAVGIGAGVALWALPLCAVSGWRELAEVGAVQGLGHFARWGGTVVTEPALGGRLAALGWQLLALGLGLFSSGRPWLYLLPTAGLLALLALAARRPRTATAWLWLAWAAPYALWAFLAQNVVEKPRHALPLSLIVLVAAALLLARALADAARLRRALAAAAGLLWIGGQAVSALALAREHQRTPGSPVRLARAVEGLCRSEAARGRRVVVYTAGLREHLALHAPCAETVLARRLESAKADASSRGPGVLGLVSSDVPRVERLRRAPILRFARDRELEAARPELALYALARVGGRDE